MSKKLSAADFVKNFGNSKTLGVDWYQKLSHANQEYVKEVIDALDDNPNASLYLVAEQLIKELNITRSHGTVARTLRRMLNNVQTKREKAS